MMPKYASSQHSSIDHIKKNPPRRLIAADGRRQSRRFYSHGAMDTTSLAAVYHKLVRDKGVCLTRYVYSFFLPSKYGHSKQSKNEKYMYIGVLNYEESKYHDRKGKRVPDNL